MAYDDEDEGEEFDQGEGLEPTPANLAHWIDEQFQGDDRFEAVDTLEPGPLEGETVRVRMICPSGAWFFVSVFEDDGLVRVGLGTEDREQSEAIEEAAGEEGQSLTEFVAELMENAEELEYEVQHFHDDAYYFCSELPYQRPEDLASDELRELLVAYLDGYMMAFYGLAEGEEEDFEDDDE